MGLSVNGMMREVESVSWRLELRQSLARFSGPCIILGSEKGIVLLNTNNSYDTTTPHQNGTTAQDREHFNS